MGDGAGHQPPSPRKRPPEEIIITEPPDLRITGAELWSEVQERLASRQRGVPSGTKHVLSARRSKYLLSGIVVYDECDKPLTIYGSSTTYYRCQTHHAKGSCGNDLRIRENLLRAECLEAIRTELQTPANLAYVRQQITDRLLEQSAQNTNELDERRQRLTAGKDRLKQLVDFIASGHRSNAVGDEIRLLETQNAADIAAIERLECHAREATRPLALLPSRRRSPPGLSTSPASSPATSTAPNSTSPAGSRTVRFESAPAPTGFEFQGTYYPLLIFRSAENKKPKSRELLGESENVLGSGGGICS